MMMIEVSLEKRKIQSNQMELIGKPEGCKTERDRSYHDAAGNGEFEVLKFQTT